MEVRGDVFNFFRTLKEDSMGKKRPVLRVFRNAGWERRGVGFRSACLDCMGWLGEYLVWQISIREKNIELSLTVWPQERNDSPDVFQEDYRSPRVFRHDPDVPASGAK
jgi:hypothetical protein